MSNFDQYMKYRILDFKFSAENSDLTEFALSQSEDNPMVKQVCAKLSIPLVDRMETSLSLLGISKRKFIEMAIIDSLDRIDQLCVELDPMEGKQEGEA